MIRTVKCESWMRFISTVRRSAGYGDRYFRGHRDRSWKLSSPAERRLAAMQGNGIRVGNPGDERAAMRRFKEAEVAAFRRHAVGIPSFDSTSFSNLDWMALARHHGVVTPLLDWTKSPYVAAWFAITDELSQANPAIKSDPFFAPLTLGSASVAVWELQFSQAPWALEEFELLVDRHALQHRQKAQHAAFTRLDHPEFFDLQSYLEHRGSESCLSVYEVSLNAAQVAIAVTDLDLMGINFATMYPDLYGAALAANTEPLYKDTRELLEKFPGID